MLIKYLLSKKYREDYSRNLAIRINEVDKETERIYNISCKSKTKKVS